MGWKKPQCQMFLNWCRGLGSPPRSQDVQFLLKKHQHAKNSSVSNELLFIISPLIWLQQSRYYMSIIAYICGIPLGCFTLENIDKIKVNTICPMRCHMHDNAK